MSTNNISELIRHLQELEATGVKNIYAFGEWPKDTNDFLYPVLVREVRISSELIRDNPDKVLDRVIVINVSQD